MEAKDAPKPNLYRARRFRLNEAALERHFVEKGITHQCPFCSSVRWRLLGTDMVPVLTVPWGTGDGHTFMEGVAAISFTCENCGFLRQHAVTLFEGVLEEVTSG